jgi:hypothetical protein
MFVFTNVISFLLVQRQISQRGTIHSLDDSGFSKFFPKLACGFSPKYVDF